MSRPSIPAELRRAVLVEAGHRCAIPRCGNTELDIHHIVPWEACKKHEYENLIALCPVCHRRAHKDEIDRKSLLQYKSQLGIAALSANRDQFSQPIIEVKRCISHEETTEPGYSFEFEFPDFENPRERIASKNLEAWGNELLVEFQEMQNSFDLSPYFGCNPPSAWLRGKYTIVRRDSAILSIKYTLVRFHTGAAHRGQTTLVQNFLLSPFVPLPISSFIYSEKLSELSTLIRGKLLLDRARDSEWVLRGTEPNFENFSLFNIQDWGVLFTFPEYQIDCYAAGEQEVFVGFYELDGIADHQFLKAARDNAL